MRMILITFGFVTAVLAMLALSMKSIVWILDAIEWIGVWGTDWRDEWRKWRL